MTVTKNDFFYTSANSQNVEPIYLEDSKLIKNKVGDKLTEFWMNVKPNIILSSKGLEFEPLTPNFPYSPKSSQYLVNFTPSPASKKFCPQNCLYFSNKLFAQVIKIMRCFLQIIYKFFTKKAEQIDNNQYSNHEYSKKNSIEFEALFNQPIAYEETIKLLLCYDSPNLPYNNYILEGILSINNPKNNYSEIKNEDNFTELLRNVISIFKSIKLLFDEIQSEQKEIERTKGNIQELQTQIEVEQKKIEELYKNLASLDAYPMVIDLLNSLSTITSNQDSQIHLKKIRKSQEKEKGEIAKKQERIEVKQNKLEEIATILANLKICGAIVDLYVDRFLEKYPHMNQEKFLPSLRFTALAISLKEASDKSIWNEEFQKFLPEEVNLKLYSQMEFEFLQAIDWNISLTELLMIEEEI